MNLSTFLIGTPGPFEIIVIVLVILLLFGGRKIPELMKGLGQGLREFKKAAKGETDKDEKDAVEEKNK